MRKRVNNNPQSIIIMVVIFIIVIFMVTCCETTLSRDIYNNGVHEGCGGHWVYDTAVGHQYSTGFIYQCDKCGITIELNKKY